MFVGVGTECRCTVNWRLRRGYKFAVRISVHVNNVDDDNDDDDDDDNDEGTRSLRPFVRGGAMPDDNANAGYFEC